jgi:hypothetical protein
MASVFNFFSALMAKIVALAAWFAAVFLQIFKDLWNVFTDLFCWLFEGVFAMAQSALSGIATPFNPATYYSMIPAETANMLGVIGIPQAFAIIVGALLTRFVLQTIPFVRWGS